MDPAEWDGLLQPDDLQATHAFVKVCQDSDVEQAAYRHLMVLDGGRPVEQGGRLVAAGVLLYAPGALTFLLAGIDYADHREHGGYLMLLNELVAEAIRAGKPWLQLGQTSYALKGRMGATLSPRLVYLRHRSPVWHAALRGSAGLLFPEHREVPRRVFRDA